MAKEFIIKDNSIVVILNGDVAEAYLCEIVKDVIRLSEDNPSYSLVMKNIDTSKPTLAITTFNKNTQ